jgi:hypothetical protein
MSNLPVPAREMANRRRVREIDPVSEYIAILRSYLPRPIKERVRRRVERLCCKRGAMISPIEYTDILQSYLTPLQRAGVVERLEMAFSGRLTDPRDV